MILNEKVIYSYQISRFVGVHVLKTCSYDSLSTAISSMFPEPYIWEWFDVATDTGLNNFAILLFVFFVMVSMYFFFFDEW